MKKELEKDQRLKITSKILSEETRYSVSLFVPVQRECNLEGCLYSAQIKFYILNGLFLLLFASVYIH